MKKLFLVLFLKLCALSTVYSQFSIAVSVDENNNIVYPLDGQLNFTNTNAAIFNQGTFANVGNAVVGGTFTATGTTTLRTNTIVGGTLTVTNTSTLIGNTTVGGTLTVTNTGTFNTNVSIAGNLTNLGNAVVGGTLTVTNATTISTGNITTGNIGTLNAGTSTFTNAVTLNTAGTTTNHAVRADRSISTSDGLEGGGNLTANITLTVDSSVVRTNNTNQTIAGTKTFSSAVVVAAPTATNHATTKSYVDTEVGTKQNSFTGVTTNITFTNVVDGATNIRTLNFSNGILTNTTTP